MGQIALLAVSSLRGEVYGNSVLQVGDAGAGPGHEQDPHGVLVPEDAGQVENGLTLVVLRVHLSPRLYQGHDSLQVSLGAGGVQGSVVPPGTRYMIYYFKLCGYIKVLYM